jgi:lipoic acid synthetase
MTELAKPDWLRVRAPSGPKYNELRGLITTKRLHTVCSSASCPNIGECWEAGTATFMIMGNICTRACRFCDVNSYSRPKPLDLEEPQRLAEAVFEMKLRHVVITSVTRDDLADFGALHFVKCIQAVKEKNPEVRIEILAPDFGGEREQIAKVAKPPLQIFNHNIETVKRLTPKIRSGGAYLRSLSVLQTVKEVAPAIKTKSGIMLGLGEEDDEVKEAIVDLRQHGVEILTIGQYLRPSAFHHAVMRYAEPRIFLELKRFALSLGFMHVESGPLVRSSYHAGEV